MYFCIFLLQVRYRMLVENARSTILYLSRKRKKKYHDYLSNVTYDSIRGNIVWISDYQNSIVSIRACYKWINFITVVSPAFAENYWWTGLMGKTVERQENQATKVAEVVKTRVKSSWILKRAYRHVSLISTRSSLSLSLSLPTFRSGYRKTFISDSEITVLIPFRCSASEATRYIIRSATFMY